MVSTPAGFVVSLNGTSETPDEDRKGTPAIGIRLAIAVLLKQSAPGVAVPGRLGTDHFVVTGSPSAMEYGVSGGGLVIVRPNNANGAYLVGLPLGVTVSTDPSDGVNPRIDVIYALQPDPAIDGPEVDPDFIVDVAQGAPAATPEEPTLPAGAYKLAQKVIAPGATNTSTGAAFTNVAPVTGLNAQALENLDAGIITTGVFPISRGGNGASNKSAARTALGFLSGNGAPPSGLGDVGDIYDQIL